MAARPLYLLRIIGYGLLALSTVDVLLAVLPPELTNPTWEFGTMLGLVDRLPVPLLGLMLIFWGQDEDRLVWEEKFLKVIAWLILVWSISFMLMLPLGIFNTLRINRAVTNSISQNTQAQIQQIETLKTRVQNASEQQLQVLVQQINQVAPQNQQISGSDPSQTKEELQNRLNNNKSKLREQRDDKIAEERTKLLKQSIKLNIGLLVGAALYWQIWRSTRWIKEL
jgi:uncharacterized membrane protein